MIIFLVSLEIILGVNLRKLVWGVMIIFPISLEIILELFFEQISSSGTILGILLILFGLIFHLWDTIRFGH